MFSLLIRNIKFEIMSTPTPATQAHVIDIPMSVSEAVQALIKLQHTEERYAQVLQKVLDAGHDINNNDSELLMSALAIGIDTPEQTEKIRLLFSLGAKVLTDKHVYDGTYGRAFTGGRVYSPGVAKLLFDNIIDIPQAQFDLITAHVKQHYARLDVFNRLESDIDKARLYIRAGMFPHDKCSAEVLELCAKAGHVPPPKPLSEKEQLEKLTADLAKVTVEKEQNFKDAQDLKERLAKATGIIAKLTSIN